MDNKEVDLDEVAKTQEELNGHVSMWVKCFGIGENWDHEDRIRQTLINHDRNVAPLYIMIKDHKPVKVGFLPATRAVVSDNKGMGCHFSGVISDIVEPIAYNTARTFESISTEDCIARQEEYNTDLKSRL